MPEPKDSNGNGLSPAAAQHSGLKPTQAEHRQYLNEVTELWARHCRPDEIRRVMRERRGLSRHATDRYIRPARDRMVKAVHLPIEELAAKSLATYVRRIVAAETALQAKALDAVDHARYANIIISAQKAIDDLFGLPRAKKVAFTTTDGQDVMPAVVAALPPELLDAMDEVGRLYEEAERGGKPSPQLLEGPEVK